MCAIFFKRTHSARLNVREMFRILTILKMWLKRNKNAHNDPYITIKGRTIRTRSSCLTHSLAHTFCTRKRKRNYLWEYCECVCASVDACFRFELLQFQSLLCSFISFPFRLFCCAREAIVMLLKYVFSSFSASTSFVDLLALLFPFQWLFPLWVLILLPRSRAHTTHE